MYNGQKNNSWKDILQFPFVGRTVKPRETGLTMVIDKGMGLTEVKEMLDMAAEYIDMVKLGFGTSALYSSGVLEEKIKLVRSYDVDIYPGGTFLEVAMLQRKLDLYLRKCKELGYSCIEVSDGTITMSSEERQEAVLKAREMGFKVLTEVGKKDPRDKVAGTAIHRQIAQDLASGAFKVIVEGRESGKGVVIYDSKGNVKEDELEDLAIHINDPDAILWEAPLKNQQQALIMRFGHNINLGNVQPNDILALEALRVGLRGDTLRMFLRSQQERSPWLVQEKRELSTVQIAGKCSD